MLCQHQEIASIGILALFWSGVNLILLFLIAHTFPEIQYQSKSSKLWVSHDPCQRQGKQVYYWHFIIVQKFLFSPPLQEEKTFSILPKLKKNYWQEVLKLYLPSKSSHKCFWNFQICLKSIIRRATVKKESRMFRPDVSAEAASHFLAPLLSKFYHRHSPCLISYSQAQSMDVALIQASKRVCSLSVLPSPSI